MIYYVCVNVFVTEKLPVGRASSVVSLVNRLVGALAECGDDVFGDRVAVVSQLLSVWSEGDEVELRCNEPPSVVTTRLSAADVDRLVAAAHADTTDAPGLSRCYLVFLSGFPRLLESPGFFFLKIPGPGNSWKITLVLESRGN